jgi:hypothetical protein
MSETEKYDDPATFLLKSKFPDIKKMSKDELLTENKMWRNIWGWIPSEVKYYISRTGQQIGLTMRNYKRYLGVLLGTYWDLTDVELGVMEKVFDQTTGEYFFERKVVKVKISNLVDVQWIHMRKPEVEIEREAEAEEAKEAEVNEQNGQQHEDNNSSISSS